MSTAEWLLWIFVVPLGSMVACNDRPDGLASTMGYCSMRVSSIDAMQRRGERRRDRYRGREREIRILRSSEFGSRTHRYFDSAER